MRLVEVRVVPWIISEEGVVLLIIHTEGLGDNLIKSNIK